MIHKVQNITAFVTGANRGIGRAITEELLAVGAQKVYVAVRNLDTVNDLVDKHPQRVIPIQFDLTDEASITRAAAEATDVNLVVSNAGVAKVSSPLETNALNDLKFQMERNVYPLLLLAQAFGTILKQNDGGAFVQMNSLASLKNFLPLTGYSASKAASYSVTQGLREAWLQQDTQVISVLAGAVKTEMSVSAGMGDGAPAPRVVALAILEALATGAFFAFPDQVSQGVSEHYKAFAQHVLDIPTT